MTSNFLKILILLFSVFQLSIADIPYRPTHHYLEQFPIEQIIKNYQCTGDANTKIEEAIPFFLDVIEKENRIPVFAYHASTENFRIYQDILEATFEEVLGYDLPEDFYFFRIPGAATYNFENGCESFFKNTVNTKFTAESKEMLVRFFILNKINSLGMKLEIEDLDPQEIARLAEPFRELPFLYYLYKQYGLELQQQNSPIKRSSAFSMDDDIQNIRAFFDLMQTERIVYKDLTDEMEFAAMVEGQTAVWQEILQHRGIGIEKEIIANKIRTTCEPVMLLNEITLFLSRLREQNLDKSDNIFNALHSFVYSFRNRGDMQAKVISLNVSLFGNYEHIGSNTTALFLQNQTRRDGDTNLSHHLAAFFEEIGLDPLLVDELTSIAKNKLREHQAEHGVLFQFYSVDDPSYNIIDKNGYVALAGGTPIKKIMPSAILSGEYPMRHHKGDFQLRLVMSNQHTLNPYSSIRMKRYDDLQPEESKALVDALKAALHDAHIDEIKRALFQYKIEQKWGIPNFETRSVYFPEQQSA